MYVCVVYICMYVCGYVYVCMCVWCMYVCVCVCGVCMCVCMDLRALLRLPLEKMNTLISAVIALEYMNMCTSASCICKYFIT